MSSYCYKDELWLSCRVYGKSNCKIFGEIGAVLRGLVSWDRISILVDANFCASSIIGWGRCRARIDECAISRFFFCRLDAPALPTYL